jgi:radical SAM protein with 4Fe4S-binding SPASM domain
VFENLKTTDMTHMAKKKTIPISVLVEVTYRCNEKCLHCCLDEYKSKGLSLEEYETLFDQMSDAGTFYMILTGGEPFTRPDFLDIVRSARKRRFSLTIFTNGTLINEDIAKELKDLHVQDVHISIYSADPKVHDKITGLPNSFERSVQAIQFLVKHGMIVRIKCPLMKITVDGIADIKNLAKNLGVSVQFGEIITAQNDGDVSTCLLRLSQEQMRHAIADPEVSSQRPIPLSTSIDLNATPCDVVFNGGAVDPDGNVYVCNQLRKALGNVKTTHFAKIWKDSPVANELRQITLAHLQSCSECDLLQYCTRCPGLALLEDGNIYGCSSAAKEVAQARRHLGVYPTQTHLFSNPRKEPNL